MSESQNIPVDKVQNANIILLSFALAYLASYVAISLCEQMRSSFLHGEKYVWKVRIKWLILIGMSLGGAGMWCLHFIGMAALTLKVSDRNEIIDVGYNSGLTIGSLILVMFAMSLGIYIASNDHLFAKSKTEIIETFIASTNKYSMAEIRKTKDSKIMYIISTQQLGHLFLGGFIAGSGVIGMHYMGVEAMEYNDWIIKEWHPEIVLASCLIAIIGSTFAFWILFRLLSIFPTRESLRLFSAGILALSFGASHYVGMEALVLHHNPGIEKSTLSKNHINTLDVIPIVLACFIVLWIFVIYAFADTRRLLYKYRNYIQLSHQKNKGVSGQSVVTGKSALDHMNDMFFRHSRHHNGKASSNGFASATESFLQRINNISTNSSNNNAESKNSKNSRLPVSGLHDIEEGLDESIKTGSKLKSMHKPPTPNAFSQHNHQHHQHHQQKNPNHAHVKFIEMIKSSTSVVPMDENGNETQSTQIITQDIVRSGIIDYHEGIEDDFTSQTSFQHSILTDNTSQPGGYPSKSSKPTIQLQTLVSGLNEEVSSKRIVCINNPNDEYTIDYTI